ncbi:MAG: peptidase prolyl oligopeptidase active site domain protein [Bryobacterales bacterium]|nr:peptidase prolyl oligopeptidase active site domain protein [Bryobacterales bacterium]
MSAPFPSELTASEQGGKIAWVIDERGQRNLWVAEGPDYKGRRVTNFQADDGQEIAQLKWLPDASAVVYVRGGDFETHGDNPNPASFAAGVEQAIWIATLAGGAPRRLAEGNSPEVSPKGDRIVFLRAGQIWTMPLTGEEKPSQLIHAKGRAGEMRWSPDGGRLAFVNNRADHSFVGVYDFGSKNLKYVDASVDRDTNPIWSPDGKRIAHIRIAASNRTRRGPVRTADDPWSIRMADVETGSGRELWRAEPGPGSAFSPMVAESQLIWGADGRLVFPWERTGFRHLYSVAANGSPAVALTSGEFEVEHVAAGWQSREILFSTNKNDIDRRHIWRVPVAGGAATAVTQGRNLEWTPAPVGGSAIAYLHSGTKTPAQAAVQMSTGAVKELAAESIPAEFPAAALVDPQQVILSASDGMPIHGQLFLPPDLKPGEKRAAMIFFHGGSRRQMLLGWHYMDYYNHAYAMNQYLASRGYVVLSVNYRSGIGYGLNFREALNYGAAGASEFNDVLGAGLYLKNRAEVDPARIGLWGGSYGGYLTALGLARASDLFAVGVDFHGVHDWSARGFSDPGKESEAARVAFESSPMASISTWRSPVLLIHGDDDRNVAFSQTVMLVEALRKQKVPFEQLIFPDEIHGFLTHRRWIEAYQASAKFMDEHLLR